MQVVDYPALAPSVCIVCEGVPPATPFVDTLRTFDPNGYTHLNGRKYVCAACVNDAAQALGLLDEAVAPVQAQVDELADANAQLQADLDNLKTVSDAITALSTRPVVKVEDTVEKAVSKAQAKRQARADAAQAAQDALANQAKAEAAGAAVQAKLDQDAADAREAAAQAAVAAPVEEPEPAGAAAAVAPVEPVADAPAPEAPAAS